MGFVNSRAKWKSLVDPVPIVVNCVVKVEVDPVPPVIASVVDSVVGVVKVGVVPVPLVVDCVVKVEVDPVPPVVVVPAVVPSVVPAVVDCTELLLQNWKVG